MDPGMVTSIMVKEFLKNSNNVINNQIIVIFYTPFTYNCQSWQSNPDFKDFSPDHAK